MDNKELTLEELKIRLVKILTIYDDNNLEHCDNIIQVKELDNGGVKFYIYTNLYQYIITAIEKTESRKSYLGCQLDCLKKEPGEDHTRGGDLPDGPMTEETLMDIMFGIIRMELCELSSWRSEDKVTFSGKPFDMWEGKEKVLKVYKK